MTTDERPISNATLWDQVSEQGAEMGVHPVCEGDDFATADVFIAEKVRVVGVTPGGLVMPYEVDRLICRFTPQNTLERVYASRFSAAERGQSTRLRLAFQRRAEEKARRKKGFAAEVKEDVAVAKRRNTDDAWRILVGRRNA